MCGLSWDVSHVSFSGPWQACEEISQKTIWNVAHHHHVTWLEARCTCHRRRLDLMWVVHGFGPQIYFPFTKHTSCPHSETHKLLRANLKGDLHGSPHASTWTRHNQACNDRRQQQNLGVVGVCTFSQKRKPVPYLLLTQSICKAIGEMTPQWAC